MAIKRNENSRIENYRHHLKVCLKDMLDRADEIMDYCYSDTVAGIEITLSLSPDTEVPTVTYKTTSICTKGYGNHEE